MFGWGFKINAKSWFWNWNLIKICVRSCDMNSTLGSVVPLAMFSFIVVKLNHVIPVANENHRSLIVPLESLLDQSFHIFKVLTCSITFIRMNKFWSLWHDYDYVWTRCLYKNIFSELWVVNWQFSQEESAYRAHWRPCGSRREPHVCFLPCCTPAAPATYH